MSTLTIHDLAHDGPPVRLRDLEAISGLSRWTIRDDVQAGLLKASKRHGSANAHLFVQRADARTWLQKLGFQLQCVAVQESTRITL